eukprot:5442613-Pleurochrysis_carterae.AAC.1
MGFSTRHMRRRPLEGGCRTPAAHDSRLARFVPSFPAGMRRRNPNAACACRRSLQWPRARGGTWGAWWRQKFDRNPPHALERIPARTGAP